MPITEIAFVLDYTSMGLLATAGAIRIVEHRKYKRREAERDNYWNNRFAERQARLEVILDDDQIEV